MASVNEIVRDGNKHVHTTDNVKLDEHEPEHHGKSAREKLKEVGESIKDTMKEVSKDAKTCFVKEKQQKHETNAGETVKGKEVKDFGKGSKEYVGLKGKRKQNDKMFAEKEKGIVVDDPGNVKVIRLGDSEKDIVGIKEKETYAGEPVKKKMKEVDKGTKKLIVLKEKETDPTAVIENLKDFGRRCKRIC